MKYLKLIAGLSLLSLSTSLYADTIFVDNKQIPVESEIKQGMNYVPLRFVAEALGATVEWQNPNVIVKKGEMTLQFTINSHNVLVNGKEYTIATTPYLSNHYTYVPLRFISEQLGCDVAYNHNPYSENTVYITSTNKTPPSIPEYVDTKDYTLSQDALWGFSENYIWGDYVITVKNMSTGIAKDIFSNHAGSIIEWKNNQLFISALNQGRNRKLLLYTPTTDTLETLVEDYYDFYVHIPEINAILYLTDGKMDLANTQYHLYSIDNKKSETISRERFHILLKQYAPDAITYDYFVSNNKLWGAKIDNSAAKGIVMLKDLSSYTTKEIFSTPDCSIEWLNNNLLIKFWNVDADSNTILMYNPTTDKLTTILSHTRHEVYLDEINAILYMTYTEVENDATLENYFIYYIDTNRSETISKEAYRNLQETYLDHIIYDFE